MVTSNTIVTENIFDEKCHPYRNMYKTSVFFMLLLSKTNAKQTDQMEANLNDVAEKMYSVKINKCCEDDQLMVDMSCRLANLYNQSKYLLLIIHGSI
jgi:hypothetical protein